MNLLSDSLKLKIENNPTNTILNKYFIPTGYVNNRDIIIPTYFDGRLTWGDLLFPVINQGKCGSCWAFASVSCLSDRFNIQSMGKMNINLSIAKLIMCNWQGSESKRKNPQYNMETIAKLNAIALEQKACYGNTLYDAWRYLYIYGTPSEECVPYNKSIGAFKKYDKISDVEQANHIPLCTQVLGSFADMCADFSINPVTGEEQGTPQKLYRALHFYTLPTEESIIKDIYIWGPVTTGIKVYLDFYKFDNKNEIYESDMQGPLISGHALVIVGYGEENGKKYWIIRNSWGTDWGDNGYFKMIRGKNNCKIEENAIAGIPDFFYPENYTGFSKYTSYYNEEYAKQRIESDINPQTGYTNRNMINYPFFDFSRPVELKDLPDWNTFIAGLFNNKKNIQKNILPEPVQIEKPARNNLIFLWVFLFVCFLFFCVLFYRWSRS